MQSVHSNCDYLHVDCKCKLMPSKVNIVHLRTNWPTLNEGGGGGESVGIFLLCCGGNSELSVGVKCA